MIEKMWELVKETNERYTIHSTADEVIETILISDDDGRLAMWIYCKSLQTIELKSL